LAPYGCNAPDFRKALDLFLITPDEFLILDAACFWDVRQKVTAREFLFSIPVQKRMRDRGAQLLRGRTLCDLSVVCP
jgi:hypothetical protein